MRFLSPAKPFRGAFSFQNVALHTCRELAELASSAGGVRLTKTLYGSSSSSRQNKAFGLHSRLLSWLISLDLAGTAVTSSSAFFITKP